MYDPQLYASGVTGVFLAAWTLRCETPLAIRNGVKISVRSADQQKSRNQGLEFRWQPKDPHSTDNSISEVTALHYGYEVVGERVVPYHYLPASSLRGALRSWTTNHLVERAYRTKMSPPKKEEEALTQAYQDAVRQALADPHSGYPWIASLFGQALDTRLGEESLSNAGRLQVETVRFQQAGAPQIDVSGASVGGATGPENARRQMTVRNPLDRVTHASKGGGLHHFLEFSVGETFEVRLSVQNPQPADLGLVCLWRRELENGMLRLGALASLGRGRVSVTKEDYCLWRNPAIPAPDWLKFFTPGCAAHQDDALADLWAGYTLPAGALDPFIHHLQQEV